MKNILYVVVPCYCEQEVLPATHKALTEMVDDMVSREVVAPESRVMFVDDGSHDNTWSLINSFCQARPERVAGVKLACNAGHQNALLAGLSQAVDHAHIMVSIDADLQDDIKVIEQMIEQYQAGSDIVYGVRRSRKSDTWFKRNTALAFYKLMKTLGVKSVYNHADFRLMSRRAVEQLLNYRERNLFLRGIVPLIGYKTSSVYYDRSERIAGESKYPLRKMLSFAVDGITSFSIRPVRLVFSLGLIFMLAALAILIYVLWRYFTGHTVSGWASLILSLWFVGGCVLMGLGIVGEYIGKIYLEVKDRPRYNVEKSII